MMTLVTMTLAAFMSATPVALARVTLNGTDFNGADLATHRHTQTALVTHDPLRPSARL
jgi:hypothetical protein